MVIVQTLLKLVRYNKVNKIQIKKKIILIQNRLL
jgi:hypothetical protein